MSDETAQDVPGNHTNDREWLTKGICVDVSIRVTGKMVTPEEQQNMSNVKKRESEAK